MWRRVQCVSAREHSSHSAEHVTASKIESGHWWRGLGSEPPMSIERGERERGGAGVPAVDMGRGGQTVGAREKDRRKKKKKSRGTEMDRKQKADVTWVQSR